MENRPSKRYMKHGFLLTGEYNQNIHNSIDPEENMEPINQRNINYNTRPNSNYYTPEEVETMKTEIKQAVCPICNEKVNDDRCRVCQIGHKFHNFCYREQTIETTKCPECRSENIKSCKGNYNNTFSGGKNKKIRNTKKTKKTRKTRKTRKTKRKIRK